MPQREARNNGSLVDVSVDNFCKYENQEPNQILRRSLLLLRGRIPLPDNAQALQREQIIDVLDVFRVIANQSGEPAGCNNPGI
jgi:hypothetical protein